MYRNSHAPGRKSSASKSDITTRRADDAHANQSFKDSDWFLKEDDVRWQPSGARQIAKGNPQGERGGVHQFGVPSCVVRCLVEMLAPYTALRGSAFLQSEALPQVVSAAKDNGRIYDPATAALFPDSFQDSEAGHIPKGWTVRPLSSVAGYLSRGIGPSYLEQGGVCVLNQKCVRDHRVDFSKSRRHDPAKKPIKDRALQPHDVLVNSTGMGTLGRVAQVHHLPEVAIVDSHLTIVRADSDTDPFFLGINLTGREAEIEEMGEGSTGQTELSRTRLGQLQIITPPSELQKAIGATVGSLLMRIAENDSQSRTLATLRGTLLPKLLSGELSTEPAL